MNHPATAAAGPALARSSPSSVHHLYAHIPFCPSKCPYCAFVTHIGSLKLLEPYLHALSTEAEHLAAVLPGGPLRSVYLGGGTPSLLSPDQLARLLDHIDRLFILDTGCEITIEAHPSTVDLGKLREFRAAGATRLSIGGESMSERELTRLSRRHDGRRVIEVIEQARAAGFSNLSVDFMYGLPEQTLDSWESTLREIMKASPDHLSLYPLSIEPRTVYARLRNRNQLELPGEDSVVEMYTAACEILRDAGFSHYEVANWARAGHESVHNLSYWRNRDFYALGAGAHGYVRPYRTENMPRTRRYIESVRDTGSAYERRIYVDRQVEISETVMLGLRLLREGLDLAATRAEFGVDVAERFCADIDLFCRMGLMRMHGDRLFLTEDAVPVANEIWGRFLL